MNSLVMSSGLAGPVIGHATTNSIRVWVRGREGEMGIIEYYPKGAPHDTKVKKFDLAPPIYEGIVDIPVLLNSSEYYYRAGVTERSEVIDEDVEVLSELPYVSISAFPESVIATTELVFGSCRHVGVWNKTRGDKCFKAINKIIDSKGEDRLKVDFSIFAGDQIYADVGYYRELPENTSEELVHVKNKEGRKKSYVIKGRAPETLDGLVEIYDQAWKLPEFKKLSARRPSYMMMDDHEVINDWSPSDFVEKTDPKFDKKKHHEPYILNNGLQAYKAFQASLAPIDRSQNGELKDQNYYYDFKHGNCDFFVLDGRSKRASDRTSMLGDIQYNKLQSWLGEDPDRVKFIVTAVPIFPDVNKFIGEELQPDTWSGYQRERQKLLDMVFACENSKIVFLSGDVHCSMVASVSPEGEPNKKIYNVISSAFNWILPGLTWWHFRTGEVLVNSSDHEGNCKYRAQIEKLESKLFTGDVITSNNFCHLKVVPASHEGGETTIEIRYFSERGKSFSKSSKRPIFEIRFP